MDDSGVAQPEEWFGLNPADSKDSAEEIDSSDEGEEEEEEDEDIAPDGGAAGQPQLDRASSNKARASAPPVAVANSGLSSERRETPKEGQRPGWVFPQSESLEPRCEQAKRIY